MSIAQNYPIIAPSLSLDFANVQALDPRITFARATTATYYGTRTALAEQNLLLQSQTFDGGGAPWSSSNVTVTPNSVAAPDGTTTAETLSENTANSNHHIGQVSTLNTNTTYTVSVFVKANTLNYAGITLRGANANYAAAEFNLSTGAISRTSALGTGYSVTSTSITSAGSGWYRCSAVVVAGASVAAPRFYVFLSDGSAVFDADGMPSYIGASNSVYLWGAQLEQRSTVTAYQVTTTQPVTNYIPVLETAASNVARFDHNPVTFESLGLLIEEQRTNLVLQSEDFGTTWANTNSNDDLNVLIAPNGTLTADKIYSTTSNDGYVSQTVNIVSGTVYTSTIYAKAAGFSSFRIIQTAAGGDKSATFTLTGDGSTSLVTAGATATITSVGNGWYRCGITYTATSTGATGFRIYPQQFGATGDGYSGIYIWGAQLEAGAFSTSYVQTVASQVTRSADIASMTGTNFSSWYNQGEGTFVTEVIANNSATTGAQVRRFLEIRNEATTEVIRFGRATSNFAIRFVLATNGVLENLTPSAAITFGTIVPNNPDTFAVGYSATIPSLVLDGTKAPDITGGFVGLPTGMTQMNIGSAGVANLTDILNGTIKRVAFYPLRLTNTQLISLTS